MRARGWHGVALLALLAMVGCDKPTAETAVRPEPAAFGEASCGACGMILVHQPAPRGQILYRDGARAFACSLGDLALLASQPSPHGKVVATWVEQQDGVADPVAPDIAARPWLDATGAHFVAGVTRKGIMGEPLLAYSTAAEATAVAGRLGGRVVRWAERLAVLPH